MSFLHATKHVLKPQLYDIKGCGGDKELWRVTDMGFCRGVRGINGIGEALWDCEWLMGGVRG